MKKIEVGGNEAVNTAKSERFSTAAMTGGVKVSKVFFSFLVPSIFATLTTSIYVLVDTIMIGQYEGDRGLLALNIALPLFSLFMALGVLFGVGGGVHYSIAKARGDVAGMRRAFSSSFVTVSAVLGVLMILTNAFFKPLLGALGADSSIMLLVSNYSRYITLGAPAIAFAMFLQAFIRNDGNPRLCMIAVIVGGCLNIILDYILVFIVKMGMSGAALATIVSYAANCLILCTHFFKKSNGLKVTKSFSFKAVGGITLAGFPSFITEIATGLVIFIFNRQLLHYMGNYGVVVYGVISNIAIVGISLFNGVAQGCQPIISANHGANRPDRIKQTAKMGLITASIFGLALLIFCQVAPLVPVWLFTSAPSETLLNLAPTAIRIYFSGIIFTSLNLFIIVYFQATVKQKVAFFLCLLRGVVLCSVLVLILPLMFGGGVIWFVMPVTELITLACGVALLLAYSRKGKGKKPLKAV